MEELRGWHDVPLPLAQGTEALLLLKYYYPPLWLKAISQQMRWKLCNHKQRVDGGRQRYPRCSFSRRDIHINLKVSALCVNSFKISFCHGRLNIERRREKRKRRIRVNWSPLSNLMSDDGEKHYPAVLITSQLPPPSHLITCSYDYQRHLDWEIR